MLAKAAVDKSKNKNLASVLKRFKSWNSIPAMSLTNYVFLAATTILDACPYKIHFRNDNPQNFQGNVFYSIPLYYFKCHNFTIKQ